MTLASKSGLRSQFFDTLFSDREGYVCIATSDPVAPKSRFNQRFFSWPKQSLQMEHYISSMENKLNCYFCVNLLEKQERIKANCLSCDFIWADMDEVNPSKINPKPQIVVQSSPGRWQAYWLLSIPIDPYHAEQNAKRIAYKVGADKSGWDLTQLMRVPLTRNYKYKPAPEIQVMIAASDTKVPPLLFEALPAVLDEIDPITENQPTPDLSELPSAEQVMYKFAGKLGLNFINTFNYEPDELEDWSRLLWKLIHYCLEVGMSVEETFVVAFNSKVNKYKRDKRPISHLWREVLKAQKSYDNLTVITADFRPLVMPQLVDPDTPIYDDLFVDRYRDWAIEATDAVEQFHDLSAVILLSTIIANSVRLETSYDQAMVPNLWGLILGDSTLSRKTTAMRMVTDLIVSLDPEMVVATDGTAEGLLTGLETRPNKTSIFYKDEVSGFFESINRREYLAGMPETLTALYDVPAIYTRRLRKETIRIESPAFIFFGGGVREKVYEALTENYVLSGFLPRFLIVSGDTDLNKLRRTGPATEAGKVKRSAIVAELADLYETYATDVRIKVGGQPVMLPPRITAHLTSDAWELYGDLEMQLVQSASSSSIPALALPTFERMSRSLLKMACVLSASRQIPKDQIILVDKKDVITAAHYIQQWGQHSIEAILNAGKHMSERRLERIVIAVENNPGIMRSTIMQHYHLTKREADDILGTLEDRGQLRKESRGRGAAYFAN